MQFARTLFKWHFSFHFFLRLVLVFGTWLKDQNKNRWGPRGFMWNLDELGTIVYTPKVSDAFASPGRLCRGLCQPARSKNSTTVVLEFKIRPKKQAKNSTCWTGLIRLATDYAIPEPKKKRQKAKGGWQAVFCCDLNERQVSISMTHHILERKCACNGACNQCSLHGTNIFFDQNPILHLNSKYLFVGITMVQRIFFCSPKIYVPLISCSTSYTTWNSKCPLSHNQRITKGSFASSHFRAKRKKNRSHKWTGTINCWLIWFVYVNWQEGMLQKAHLFSHGGWMHWMNALAGRPGLGPAKVSSWSVEWRSPPRWCLNWVVCGWAFNQANQRQLQPFFIMSPSDLLATQVLNAFKNVALAIVTERHMKKKLTSNNKQHANSAIQHQLSLETQRKLKTDLRILRSKTVQPQVVLLGIAPF